MAVHDVASRILVVWKHHMGRRWRLSSEAVHEAVLVLVLICWIDRTAVADYTCLVEQIEH